MSEASIGGAASFQNWLPLYADALGVRKGSSTVRAARPQGALLCRLALQHKPADPRTGKPPVYVLGITDKEQAELRAEEERKEAKRVAAEMGEDEDDDEEYEAAKKAAAEKAKRGPGLFDPGGTFGAQKDPEVMQQLSLRPYKLRVYIYQAHDLPVADADGGADPFVVVRCGTAVSRTQVCAATTSPAWFAEVPLDVQLPVCSRPDMLSFGAMVHNAKRVERARRLLAQQLFRSKLAKAAHGDAGGREDVGDWVAEPDPNPGGRLLEESFEDGWYDDGDGGGDGGDGTRVPGAAGLAAEESDEDVEEYDNGDILRWAVPLVQLTVYDKSPMGDEPLAVASIPAARLWGRHSTGGEDEAKQILRHLPMRWYPLRAFEFRGARLNRPVEGSGGRILVALSVEGPCDSIAAVLDAEDDALAEARKLPVVPSNYEPGCAPLASRTAGEGPPTVKAVTLRTQPAELQVMLLGVRGLKPLHGLPVTSPAVEFELTGVLPIRAKGSTGRVDHSSLIARSVHSSRPTGANANYRGEVMCLRGKFPLEEKCYPGLTIRVRDKRLGSAPIVGIASMARLPSRSVAEPSAAELAEENALWEYIRAIKAETGDKEASMRSGLSEISGTDDGHGHKRPRGEPPGDPAPDDDGGFDPHGLGQTPDYLKGRLILSATLEDLPGVVAPFYTVQVNRQGGGDSGEENAGVGFVKFCLRKVPMVPESVPSKGVSIKDAEEMGLYTALEHMSVDPPLDPLKEQIGGVNPQKLVVRAYVLRGLDLRPANSNGLSCPYLVASLGPRQQGGRGEAIEDTCYPPFFRVFEFKPALPGASALTIRVMNANSSKLPGAKDVVIGETTVDLEDRWFSDIWRSKFAAMPPLERRPLRLSLTGAAQGKLEMFVTIEDAGAAGAPFNIAPPPPESVELRLVVWQARNCVNKKVILAQNDLFFRAVVQGVDRLGRPVLIDKATDIHWFASSGTGSFNYRLVYRFDLPLTNPQLKISGWCKVVAGTNDDTIGEAIIETETNSGKSQLAAMCGDMIRSLRDARKRGNKKDDVELLWPLPGGVGADGERRWVPLYMPGKKGVKTGEVQIQFVLTTAKRADSKPVGEGQDEPNRDPILPKPDRATLDLFNPLGSLMTIIGPERLRQFIFVTSLVLILVAVSGIFLVVANDFVSAEIQKRLGVSKGHR
jgi:hypothetical protein